MESHTQKRRRKVMNKKLEIFKNLMKEKNPENLKKILDFSFK